MVGPQVSQGDVPSADEQAESVDATSQDLRRWLDEVEGHGQLLRVTAPVEADEEMAAVTYLAARTAASPALLFEQPRPVRRDTPPDVRSLWNLIGPNQPRLAITLGLPPDTGAMDTVRFLKQRLAARRQPRHVPAAEAPVLDNTLAREQIDLEGWPFPRHWPQDGGRYCGTADLVITRDPVTQVLNVGTYRMMLHGPAEVGLYMSPGKGARDHLEKAWANGQALDVVAVFGVHPALMMVSSQSLPRSVSELDVMGGLVDSPLAVTAARHSDLPIPAFAEVAIEAVIPPDSMKPEGPFGEFTGYYGRPQAPSPAGNVVALHFRHAPVLTNALMGDFPSNEQELYYALARAARIWSELETLGVPGVTGVYCHPAAASGLGATIVALEQQHPGHAEQVLSLAAHVPGGAYFTKWVILVDADIDPSDFNQVLWAMSVRCSPADRVSFLRDTWNTGLDPAINPPEQRPYGSRALINACMDHRYLGDYSPRTLLREGMYRQVAQRWQHLGLPGTPPTVVSFEDG